VTRLFRIVDGVNDWVGWLLGFQILLVVGVVVWEVVARYVFNAPTLWANETMVYVTAVAYLLGGGYALLHRRHVVVDVVYARFPTSVRARLDVATFFFFALYLGAMMWAGWLFAWDSMKLGETSGTPWNPPIWPVKLAIPLAAVLVLLQGVTSVTRQFRERQGAPDR
jgi:TRAP-type mannitol/chloroaromatic compound transport system permease small subunit